MRRTSSRHGYLRLMQLVWTGDHYAPGDTDFCTVAEFCRDNRHDRDICRAVRALRPGEVLRGGGGAAGAFEIERVGRRKFPHPLSTTSARIRRRARFL